MSAQPGSNTYFNVPDAYENFMGRFSRQLAPQFSKAIPLQAGDRVLDLGCGPGALTGHLVELVGANAVSVLDPSPPFLEACLQRYPGVTGKLGAAEDIPFDDNAFDAVMSQLVIHFFVDLERAGSEMVRVTKPGGWIAACTWLFDQMDMLHLFDIAAKEATGQTPPSPPSNGFRQEGVTSSYFTSLGLEDVSETTLRVSSTYREPDELWNAYMAGSGPIGPWLLSQPDEVRADIRQRIFKMLGDPTGEITLNAVACSARGRVPMDI